MRDFQYQAMKICSMPVIGAKRKKTSSKPIDSDVLAMVTVNAPRTNRASNVWLCFR